MTNKLDATSGKHYAHGTGVLTFENVTVVKPGEGVCSVKGGKVVTSELTATTLEVPAAPPIEKEMGLKFQPVGASFAEFEIEGEKCPAAVKGKYVVTGSVIGKPEGATVSFERGLQKTEEGGPTGTTGQETLKTRNKNAGLKGKLTIIGTDEAAGDKTYTPLTVTTKET